MAGGNAIVLNFSDETSPAHTTASIIVWTRASFSARGEQKGFAYHFVSFLFLQILFIKWNKRHCIAEFSVRRLYTRPPLALFRVFLGICHSAFSCSILLLFVWFCADVDFCSLSIKLERFYSSSIANAARVQWDERPHQIFVSLLLPSVGNRKWIELSQRARYCGSNQWNWMEGKTKMCVSGNWISLGAKTEIKIIRTHKKTSACLCWRNLCASGRKQWKKIECFFFNRTTNSNSNTTEWVFRNRKWMHKKTMARTSCLILLIYRAFSFAMDVASQVVPPFWFLSASIRTSVNGEHRYRTSHRIWRPSKTKEEHIGFFIVWGVRWRRLSAAQRHRSSVKLLRTEKRWLWAKLSMET